MSTISELIDRPDLRQITIEQPSAQKNWETKRDRDIQIFMNERNRATKGSYPCLVSVLYCGEISNVVFRCGVTFQPL